MREEGIDRTLNENEIGVIVGPADSQLASIAAGSGELGRTTSFEA